MGFHNLIKLNFTIYPNALIINFSILLIGNNCEFRVVERQFSSRAKVSKATRQIIQKYVARSSNGWRHRTLSFSWWVSSINFKIGKWKTKNLNFHRNELASIPISFQTVELEGVDPNDSEYVYEDEERPKSVKFARQITSRRKLKSKYGRMEFQSVCPSRRTHVLLNTDQDFEYRPHSYEEIYCAHPFDGRMQTNERNSVCFEGGFSCIQQNRTIFVSRRSRGSDCWEVESRVIAAGCECMWPKHHFGDIKDQHN